MAKKKHTALWLLQLKAEEEKQTCPICGYYDYLTADHIVPVSLLKEFEIDDYEAQYDMEEGMRLLCRECNKFKGNHLDLREPKTYEILRSLMQRAENKYILSNTDNLT